MTQVHFKTKELKEILKCFEKFAANSNVTPIVTVAYDPFRLIMSTDHAFVSAEPKEVSVATPLTPFSFNISTLLKLPLTGDEVGLFWDSENSELGLRNHHLSTSLKVAVPAPDFTAIPQSMDSFKVPLGVLVAINKYLTIPFSFFTGKKELMPVAFEKNKEGNLTAYADDGYSLARIDTEVPVELDELEIKVPKYMLDCLYGSGDVKDETIVKVGIEGYKSSFSSNNIQIFASGMNDELSDFATTIKGFKPRTSCEFSPKDLSQSIKPLVSILPKKDKSETVLSVQLNNKQKMSMAIRHAEIGDAKIDEVEGVDNVYIENHEKTSTVNMHPKSFQDYTNLFQVEKGKLKADEKMVHYDGDIVSGGIPMKIEYLFPTVRA